VRLVVGGPAAHMDAPCLGGFHAGLGSFPDQVALEFGHGGKDVELEFAGWVDGSGRGVDALGWYDQPDIGFEQGVDDAGEVLGGSAEAVQLVGKDHLDGPGLAVLKQAVEGRPVTLGS